MSTVGGGRICVAALITWGVTMLIYIIFVLIVTTAVAGMLRFSALLQRIRYRRAHMCPPLFFISPRTCIKKSQFLQKVD